MDKKKIIALVGKEGTRLNEIRDFIIKKYNACPMQYYTTNPSINQQYMTYLNPNGYIEKIFDETILEARINNCEVEGSYIPDENKNLFVGIYSLYSLENLCQSNKVDICPIIVNRDERKRFISLMKANPYMPMKTLCNYFIKKDREWDEDYISSNITVNCHFYNDKRNDYKFKGIVSILDNFVK